MARRKKVEVIAELEAKGVEFDPEAKYGDLCKLLEQPEEAEKEVEVPTELQPEPEGGYVGSGSTIKSLRADITASPPIAEGVKSREPAEPADEDAMIQCCNCLGMAKAKETFRCNHCGKGGCKACGWWPIKSGYCPNCATPVPKEAMGK